MPFKLYYDMLHIQWPKTLNNERPKMSVCQDQRHVACAAEEQPADLGAESADEEVAAQSEDAHGSLVGNPDMARVQMEA